MHNFNSKDIESRFENKFYPGISYFTEPSFNENLLNIGLNFEAPYINSE